MFVKAQSLRSKSEPSAKKARSSTEPPTETAFNPVWGRLALGIQPKLAVSAPDDPYEREADRVADAVMRMPEPGSQRKCAACSAGGTTCPDCEEEARVQRKTDGASGAGEVGSDFASRLGGGASLDAESRAFFEPRFGRDLSDVRVHTGPEAAVAARSINARAFTLGRNVAFAAGEYDPRSDGGRSLLAHELVHVAQQTAAPERMRGQHSTPGQVAVHAVGHVARWTIFRRPEKPTGKDNEAERIEKLEADYAAAIAKPDWEMAALLLNAYSPEGIEKKLRKLSGTDQAEIRYAAPTAMPNFSARIVDAVDAVNKDAKRISEIINNYEIARKVPDWKRASLALNGFDEIDIAARVKRLNLAELAALKAGALAAIPPEWPNHVVKSIEKRQDAEARPVESREKNALGHLERLATKAATETDGKDFQTAVQDFKKQLQIDLESVPTGQPLPVDLQIVVQALLLWDVDKGDQWGEGRFDSKDFTPSAGDYAVIPASQNKCNAFLAEVIFKALGVVHKGHLKEGIKDTEPRAWFPYRAAEWSDSSFAIPNFSIVSSPLRGDILCTGGHVGIYLGSHAGKAIYVSARDDNLGLFAESEQFKHGIQIKYTKPGIYRRFTP